MSSGCGEWALLLELGGVWVRLRKLALRKQLTEVVNGA